MANHYATVNKDPRSIIISNTMKVNVRTRLKGKKIEMNKDG